MHTTPRTPFRLRSVAVSLLSFLVLTGCASTHRYSQPCHSTFIEENVTQLHVGMLPREVVTLFGEPDEQYVSSFGADVGEPWTGRVWVYFVRPDSRLMYARRYEKNVFVFHPPQGEMKLNHWELENQDE